MNGHDFTLEQNTEARMMLAVAAAAHRRHQRRGERDRPSVLRRPADHESYPRILETNPRTVSRNG